MSQVTSGLEEKDISPTNSRKSTEKNAADADDKGSETEKLSSKKEQAAKERPDWTDALHMLHTLNDCTWCTNLFVKERERESHTQNIGLCVNKQKDFYSLSDVRKELKYIELILDRLKESILTLADKKYRSKEYCLIKDTVDGSWPKNIVDDGEKIADSDYTGEKPLDGRIGRKRKGKDSANNGYDEGFELRVIRAKEYDLKCDGDFEIAGLGNDVNTTYLFRNIGDNVAAVVGECRSIKSMTLDALREIDWREDLRAKQRRVNEKIGMMNDLLGIVSSDDELKEDVKSVREFFARKRTEVPKELRLTKDPSESCHPCHSCNPSRVADVDALLFDKEKWRIDVVRRNGGDPLEHLEGIALPIDYDSFKSDTRATYYGIKRKNLLGISLQTADMTEQFRKNRTSVTFHFLMLLLEISLYLTDTVSDLILALDHFFNGNKIYAYLTIAFVLAPILAEMLSKFILKVLGWDKEYGRFTWKDVFNFNDFRISMRMKDSVVYTLNSMKDYGMVAATYGDLHSYRCRKGKTEYKIKTVAVEMDDSIHIQKVFYAMFKWNERFVLQTLLAESLNESAPQLLLQLTIVIKQYYGAEKIGVMSWISIVTSVLSLSYVMQLSHYNRHYHTGGRILNNSFKIKARLLEFLGNCFVHGARITAICLVTFLFEAWFIFGAFVYLIAIYFVMITCSGRKEIYRTLHRYKTTIFWPLHRLFTIPYRIGIWRMDSLDHLLFYLEIVCLALSLPFLLPVHDKENLAWIVSAAILSCEVIGVVILCVFKKFFHPYGYVCKNR